MSGILSFLFPELLLLIVPLVFLYIWRARVRGLGGGVRIAALVLVTLMAAVPIASIGGKGVDVVVVVDVSRSMPAESRRVRLPPSRFALWRPGKPDTT